jgi:hypothetical protein
LKAYLDEATPEVEGALAYIVVATVLIEDDQAVAVALKSIFADRRRSNPFHWHREGTEARERMISCLVDLGAIAHVVVHHPTGRRKQEQARADSLRVVLPMLHHDGVSELVIESRSSQQDQRDRQTLVEFGKSHGDHSLYYGWDSKVRPELWMPDAVCGAVSNFLDGSNKKWYERLQTNGVIGEPCYIRQA